MFVQHLELDGHPDMTFKISEPKLLMSRFVLHIVIIVSTLVFPTISQAETDSCGLAFEGFQRNAMNYTPSGKGFFLYEREFDWLSEMSGNTGELAAKTENLEEYYLEFLARVEISQYLKTDFSQTWSNKGEETLVMKIENPFSLSFRRTKFCHFEKEDGLFGLGKKKYLMFIGIFK